MNEREWRVDEHPERGRRREKVEVFEGDDGKLERVEEIGRAATFKRSRRPDLAETAKEEAHPASVVDRERARWPIKVQRPASAL